jgi:hypothetical protein
MQVKNLTYRVVWQDGDERCEEFVVCDETRRVDGERQFLKNKQVRLAIGDRALISYQWKRTSYRAPRSIGEFVELLRWQYRHSRWSPLDLLRQ